MSNNISYEVIKNLLMGDSKSDDELAIVLDFLEHTASVIRNLYWAHRIKYGDKTVKQDKIENLE